MQGPRWVTLGAILLPSCPHPPKRINQPFSWALPNMITLIISLLHSCLSHDHFCLELQPRLPKWSPFFPFFLPAVHCPKVGVIVLTGETNHVTPPWKTLCGQPLPIGMKFNLPPHPRPTPVFTKFKTPA